MADDSAAFSKSRTVEGDSQSLRTSSQRRKTGVLISYLYMAAQVIVQLVYVPLLLGSIGQDEYGLYQLVGSIMAYVVSINGVLSAGVGRFYCKYLFSGDDLNAENTLAIARRLYWMLSGLMLVIVAILIGLFRAAYASSFSQWQLDECSLMLVVLALNTIVTMNNAVNIAAITAYERFAFLKLSQLITLVVQPVLVVALTSVMHNALAVTFIVLVMNALCALVQRVYAKDVLHIRCTYRGWDRALAKNLLHFSAAIVTVTIADQVFWKTDQLIIGYFYGASLVAVYAVGAQVYQAYISIGTVVPSLFLPRVSELYNQKAGLEEISRLYARVGRVSCLICLVVLGAFAIIGKDFITLWAGSQYAEAYYVALLVMAAFTVDVVQNLSNTILQVVDRYYFRGAMLLGIALVNVVVTVALVPSVGIVGAALSTAVCVVVGNGLIMNCYMARRVGIDVRLFFREVGPLVTVGACVIVACYLLYHNLPFWHQSWLTIVVAGATYVLLLFVFLWKFALNEYEKQQFKKLAHRFGLKRGRKR